MIAMDVDTVDDEQTRMYSEEILPIDIWFKIFEPLSYSTLIVLEATCKVDFDQSMSNLQNFQRILRSRDPRNYYMWRREYLSAIPLIKSK